MGNENDAGQLIGRRRYRLLILEPDENSAMP